MFVLPCTCRSASIRNTLGKSLEKPHESPNFPMTTTFFLQVNRNFVQNTSSTFSIFKCTPSSTLKSTQETASSLLFFDASIVLLIQFGTKVSSINSTTLNSLFLPFDFYTSTSKTGPLMFGFTPPPRPLSQFQQGFPKVFLLFLLY